MCLYYAFSRHNISCARLSYVYCEIMYNIMYHFLFLTFLQSFGVDGLPVGFIPAKRRPAEMLDGGCREGGAHSSHSPARAKGKGIPVRETPSPAERPGGPPSAIVDFGRKGQRIVQKNGRYEL